MAQHVTGQLNLIDALDRRIDFTADSGKEYRLGEELPTIVVRPRGWHLPEQHLLVDGSPISGSLVDFGLYFFHCARRQLDRGSGPYFYLAKLENHLEARLWNDVFCWAQDQLGIPRGTIRATVLIETITAAFEMEEILYELRDHSAGLNAGRWDYIFSLIKNFRTRGQRFVLPDRAAVTMTTPFMRAYTELLVRTCHRRGAHAIGGMAAFVPDRHDEAATAVAFDKVRGDKERESKDGFDGSWVAHPDLVPICRAVFDGVLGQHPNQLDRTRDDVDVSAADLLAVETAVGDVTEAGLRANVRVSLGYLDAWLGGQWRCCDRPFDGGRGHYGDRPVPGLAVAALWNPAGRWPSRHGASMSTPSSPRSWPEGGRNGRRPSISTRRATSSPEGALARTTRASALSVPTRVTW